MSGSVNTAGQTTNQNQNQNQVSQLTPYAAATPALQGILGGLSGISPNLTGRSIDRNCATYCPWPARKPVCTGRLATWPAVCFLAGRQGRNPVDDQKCILGLSEAISPVPTGKLSGSAQYSGIWRCFDAH